MDGFFDLGSSARIEEKHAWLGSVFSTERLGRLSRSCGIRRMVGWRVLRAAVPDGHCAVIGLLPGARMARFERSEGPPRAFRSGGCGFGVG